MKKLIAVLSAAAMLLSLAACGKTDAPAATTTEAQSWSVKSVIDAAESETAADESGEVVTTETADGDKGETKAEDKDGTKAEAESVSEVKSESKTESDADDEVMTTEDVVALYNSSANKIKSSAKSITRNYQKMQNLPEYLELPSAIESLGEWAIEKFVKGSDEPAEFDEKSEIMEYFPVSNEDYTSHLTADMVKSTTIEESDKDYRITITLKDDSITSPEKGKGYAGVFNTVTASTFNDISVPGTTFEKVNVKGLNGKIVFIMNKETKQITHLTLYNTDYLDLGVKVAGANLTAKMAFSNENDYTIKY